MWAKPLIIIFLFYFFALLQNAFFAQFNFFGAVPNLVFILFFLLVFFSKKNEYNLMFFYAIAAGLFLDLFSASYFGISIILLLAIGFLAKKLQEGLQEKSNDKFPIVYFLPLFLISLLIYLTLFRFYVLLFNWNLLAELAYNLLFAIAGFYIFKAKS